MKTGLTTNRNKKKSALMHLIALLDEDAAEIACCYVTAGNPASTFIGMTA